MDTGHTVIVVRRAEERDLPLLALMNQTLIRDEGSRNPMSLPELEARMSGWLASEWCMAVLEVSGAIIGYSVFRIGKDSYFPERDFVYVRQYFIRSEYRGKGLGRACFKSMVETHFPKGCRIELESLATNPGGMAFWRSLGFEVYSTTYVK